MNEQIIVEMLKKQEQLLKKIEKGQSAPQQPAKELDIEKVDSLSTKLTTTIDKISEVVDEVRKPVINERRFTLDIASKGAISLFTVLIIAVVILSSSLYFTSRPNYDQRDNDLKYRYIKMKGEATPTTIVDLETLFELNRDNTKIQEMLHTVKTYEETIQKQAIANEQARLKLQELDQLNKSARELKDNQ